MARLSQRTLLGITLSTICSRNRYTMNPAPVVDELIETAGDHVDVLRETVGSWVGYYEDGHTRTLCTALREIPGLDPWISEGAHRRGLPDHRTPPPSYDSRARS